MSVKIHTILARALHHAVQDRQALVDAYHGEGDAADGAKRDIAQYIALGEKLKVIPARKLHTVMTEELEEVSITELRKRISARAPAPSLVLDTIASPCTEDEVMYEKAKAAVLATCRASTSVLQRRLGIAYNQANRLLTMLEARGVIGPENGATPRVILIQA